MAGLSSAYSAAVPRGRLLAQVAVMLAGGDECVADMAALRDQPDLFGEVASGSTNWRAVREIDAAVLDALSGARAAFGYDIPCIPTPTTVETVSPITPPLRSSGRRWATPSVVSGS